jgi:hypothetical protein
MSIRLHLIFLIASIALTACAGDPLRLPGEEDPEAGFTGGAPFDEEVHDVSGGKADLGYTRPTDLPELEAPEVRVSIDGLTAHVFDRATGFSAVYEVGLGRLGSSGRSFTPIGHFTTAADSSNAWWNIDARWYPEYYMGLPFLRFSKTNGDGAYTYGMHGPVTDPLRVGYVSGGCVRMHPDDIVELYWLLKAHPGSPISIQQEVELDADGEPVTPGEPAALFEVGQQIPYGASLGHRTTGFVGDPCASDDECGDFDGGDDAYCHPAGFCTLPCAGACPDLTGKAPTFCAADPDSSGGVCVSTATDVNGACVSVPGTAPETVSRYVGDSGSASATREVCQPVAQ